MKTSEKNAYSRSVFETRAQDRLDDDDDDDDDTKGYK